MAPYISDLRYSPKFKVNIDLRDTAVYCARKWNYGKKLHFTKGAGHKKCYYITTFHRTLHRMIADACVLNPRPDIFNCVDHISGDTEDNSPENLRWVNKHLNNNNRTARGKHGPPGVEHRRFRTGNGKFYNAWVFQKCGKIVYSGKKEAVIAFAERFKVEYFNALYKAYVVSPAFESDEWFAYWSAILINNKCKMTKKQRSGVISFTKFVVDDRAFKKLTIKNIKTCPEKQLKQNVRKKSKNGHPPARTILTQQMNDLSF